MLSSLPMRALTRIGSVAVGIALALSAVELYLRATNSIPEVANPLHKLHESDAELGWRGKRNVRARFQRPDFSTLVCNDASGWRLPCPPPPQGARRRILVLGDSFSWGWGVSQGEVVSDVLQAAVGGDTAIVNRSVNGYGTAQQLLLMRREFAHGRYDDVVLFVCRNDLADNLDDKNGRRPVFTVENGELELRPTTRPLGSPLEAWIKHKSRALSYLDFQFDRVRRRLSEDSETIQPMPARAEDAPGVDVTRELVRAMHRECAAVGTCFSVIRIPAPAEFDARAAPAADGEAARVLLGSLSREGIRVIELAQGFRAAAERGDRLVFEHDSHWNARGHALAAELLLGSILFAPDEG
jgi:hypothetical protein